MGWKSVKRKRSCKVGSANGSKFCIHLYFVINNMHLLFQGNWCIRQTIFVQDLNVVLSLFYTMPYILWHYTYTPYRLCTNLCMWSNSMNNVDCGTRRNLVIEAWTVTGGKFVDMQMKVCTEGRRKSETKNRKPAEVKMNRVKNFSLSMRGAGSAWKGLNNKYN